mmetsp:Transcript_29118/g.46360  ORF Transcript_29118/g.46360 Transcript_29118/m.46360 type:complete len:859 (+) Transcript_29118:116-2692(+)
MSLEDRRACREVGLDLLKTLMSDALLRKVGVQDRSDRPWRTVVQALRHAIPDEDITEAEVRRRLIEIYLQESRPDGTSKLMEAKLNDELSYFHKAGYESVEQMKHHWEWYLCCLTHEEDSFECSKLLRHLKSHVTDLVHKIDLKPGVASDFSVAFQFFCKVCYKDYTQAAGAVVFEATNQGHPVLQLVFGAGERQGRLILKMQSKSGYGKSGWKEPAFVEKQGFITKSGDILKQTMTIEAAKKRAATLPNCRGFSFKGPNLGQPVEVFFKDAAEIKVQGQVYDPYGARYFFPGEWKSYLLEDPGLQEWLVSKPLQPGAWQDVCLVKGSRYISLKTRPASGHHEAEYERVEWDAAEQLDPFYCELSTSDALNIGASRDGICSVQKTGGWLAEVLVTVGETQRETKSSPHVDMVRMPLDKVDLQAIAVAFETEIIVDHLMEGSWLFSPCHTHRLGRCARLLRHMDLWAAMTTARAFEDEPLQLSGALVELEPGLPGHLRPVSRCAAAILGYEPIVDAYKACVDQFSEFRIQRNLINRVIYKDATPEMFIEDEGPEILRHMPTKSLSFYLLGQLVKKIASHRLETCHLIVKGSLPADALRYRTFLDVLHPQVLGQSKPAIAATPSNEMNIPLQSSSSSKQVADGSSGESGNSSQLGAQGFKPAGKDDVPRPPRSAVAAPSPVAPVATTTGPASSSSPCATNGSQLFRAPAPQLRRRSYQEVKAEVAAGRKLELSVTSAFEPFAPGQMSVKALDAVFVVEFREHWAKCHSTRREDLALWCPTQSLTLWRVISAFKPDRDWNIFEQCLPLEVGQDIVVTQIFEGDRMGWCRGRIYADNDEACSEGIFPMQNLVQEVFVVTRHL